MSWINIFLSIIFVASTITVLGVLFWYLFMKDAPDLDQYKNKLT